MFPSNKTKTFFLSCALCAGLFSCGGEKHLVDYAYGFGTNWTIHLYEGTQQDVDEIISVIGKCSRLLDSESSVASGLGVLNRTGEVHADPFLLEAVTLGKQVEEQAHGAYSIRIGKLASAWKESLAKGRVLSQERVASLTEEAQATHVEIDGSVIRKSGEGTIDLSSLGKGLCQERIQALLKEKGIQKYFVDGGTSSLLFGKNSSSSGETVVRLKDAPTKSFRAKDCAVSCSSVSEQNWTIGEVKYSHLIDARNGQAVVAYDGLYLRGEKAGALDALSTAYIVLGQEYVSELEQQGIQACYVRNQEVAYATASFLD